MVAPRLCLVVGQLGRGGLEKQVALIACGLKGRGFHVEVVCLSTGGAWVETLRAAGVAVVELRRRRHFDVGRLAGLVRALRRMRPDLVYAFNYPTTAYARVAGLLASVPGLVTGERGVYMTRSQAMLERLLARVTECVICNAEAIRRDLVERVGIPPHKVITVPNAVEAGNQATRRAARSHLGVAGEDVLVGTVARVEAVKNLPLFVEAARLLGNQGVAARFCIIGGGGGIEALQGIIREARIEDRFILTGEVASVGDFLPAFDVFVLTSRSEGMPNTVMEAMAAGLPCVCTDVGGCRELVEPAITGYLVPSGDAPAMAGRIRELILDPALRLAMGDAGRVRIRRDYSVEALVGRTEAVLRKLLSRLDSNPRGRRLPDREATE